MAVLAVENLFNIEIDRYIRMDVNSTARLVDHFGGIVYELKREIIYRNTRHNISIELIPGLQSFDGIRFAATMRYGGDNSTEVINWQANLLSEFFTQSFIADNSLIFSEFFEIILSLDGNFRRFDFLTRKNNFVGMIENDSLNINVINTDGFINENGLFMHSSPVMVEIDNVFN